MQHLPLLIPDLKQLGHDALVLPAVESAGHLMPLALDLDYFGDCPALAAVLIHVADQVLLLALQAFQAADKSVLRPVTLPSCTDCPAEALQREGGLLVLPDAEMLVMS